MRAHLSEFGFSHRRLAMFNTAFIASYRPRIAYICRAIHGDIHAILQTAAQEEHREDSTLVENDLGGCSGDGGHGMRSPVVIANRQCS